MVNNNFIIFKTEYINCEIILFFNLFNLRKWCRAINIMKSNPSFSLEGYFKVLCGSFATGNKTDFKAQ